MDALRLDKIIENYRETIDARRRSRNLLIVGGDGARHPFEMTPRKAVQDTEPVAAAEIPEIEPFVTEKTPPIMFVRAIMVVGKDSIAVMDIEDVGNGLIVKVGYVFRGGQGKVVRILPDRVTVQWAGKNFDITPGL